MTVALPANLVLQEARSSRAFTTRTHVRIAYKCIKMLSTYETSSYWSSVVSTNLLQQNTRVACDAGANPYWAMSVIDFYNNINSSSSVMILYN